MLRVQLKHNVVLQLFGERSLVENRDFPFKGRFKKILAMSDRSSRSCHLARLGKGCNIWARLHIESWYISAWLYDIDISMPMQYSLRDRDMRDTIGS